MNTNVHISEEELRLIDQYMNDELHPEERIAFEQKMNADKEWKQKVTEIKELTISIQEVELRKLLTAFHAGIKPATQAVVKKITWIKRLAVAAIFIGVISAAGWLLFGKSVNEKLYQAYYEADPGLPTEMGITNNYTFNRAMIDYKTGNYQAALTSWEKLLSADNKNDTLNYFAGMACLAIDSAAKAVEHLQIVTQNKQSVFEKEANWYLGLALLKEKHTIEAAAAIRKSDHPRKNDLLDKLNSR